MRPGFTAAIADVLEQIGNVPAPPKEFKTMDEEQAALVAARMLAEMFTLAPDEVMYMIDLAQVKASNDIRIVALERKKPTIVMVASQMAMFFMGYTIGSKL